MTRTTRDGPGVLVVGSGISGLTTGIVLLEAGFDVRILTKERAADTTSAVAAAIWHPFQQLPDASFHEAAGTTYATLRDLASVRESGVLMVPLTEYFREPTPTLWWSDIASARPVLPGELPAGYRSAYRMSVPMADTSRYLPYMEARFLAQGGGIVTRTVTSLASLAAEADIVVHCAGLEAGALAGDAALHPTRGQILRIARTPAITECRIDDSDPERPTYIFLRNDDCILGGTAHPHATGEEFPADVERDILRRCRALNRAIGEVEILDRKVGFRPSRPTIRVEADPVHPSVIHNYGHGGSGYTTSWGCAAQALRIARGIAGPS